jgi:lipopolysaccharide transport system permease protein
MTMRNNPLFSKIYFQSISILVEASIYKQHKNSFLGSAWGLVQPFVYIMIISYIFSFLLKQPNDVMVMNLVASLPVWSFINGSLTASTKSLTDRSEILKKVYIPKTLLPVTDVLVYCYSLVYSFAAMYFAFCIIYPENFSFSILYAPIVAAPMIITVILMGICLAYLTPYIMDIPQMLVVILNAIYWGLPIVYPYSMVPDEKKWIFEINPLFHLIRPIQILVREKSFPDLIIMLKSLGVMFLLFIVTYFIVKKISKNVVYYL